MTRFRITITYKSDTEQERKINCTKIIQSMIDREIRKIS